MSTTEILESPPPVSDETMALVRQIRDYCHVGIDLFWQRQLIFSAALSLAAYYFDLWLSIVTLILISLSEVYDYMLFRKVMAWRGRSERAARNFVRRIYFGTILSASVISFYAVSIALQQGPAPHFLPLFFLFAAALFAAVNNHQLLPILSLRLAIYGLTFLFIPIHDVVVTGVGIESELWMQLFTVIFVLYFIVDCSRIFLNMYRANVRQLEKLKEEHAKTKVAYIAKTEFIGTITHELRTPLTSIKGFLDLACAGALGELPEKVEKGLSISQRNTNHLTSIINEILDLQKFEAGKSIVAIEPINLGEAVENAVELNRAYAEKLGVSIQTTPIDGDIQVKADGKRLQQVLFNLLSNAAKFSKPDTEVVVSAELHGEFARILVCDEGIGLEESQRNKVFEEFSQVDSTDKRQVGGTGLGMNISKRIMEALGGQIDYRSNNGSGTTFFIDIPLHQKQTITEVKPSSNSEISGGIPLQC